MVIKHKDGTYALYSHLANLLVKLNDVVKPDQIIANVAGKEEGTSYLDLLIFYFDPHDFVQFVPIEISKPVRST